MENAGAYFDKNNGNAAIKLDVLMLTQGWRRFKWNDALQNPKPDSPFLFETGLTLSGAINPGKKNEKPIDLSLTMLMAKADLLWEVLMKRENSVLLD